MSTQSEPYPLAIAFQKAVGVRKHRSTVYRWATKGIQAANGQRVFLNHRPVGRELYCTVEDVLAFEEACKSRLSPKPVAVAKPTAMSQREREKRLRNLGLNLKPVVAT